MSDQSEKESLRGPFIITILLLSRPWPMMAVAQILGNPQTRIELRKNRVKVRLGAVEGIEVEAEDKEVEAEAEERVTLATIRTTTVLNAKQGQVQMN